jgi:hypothetical protein
VSLIFATTRAIASPIGTRGALVTRIADRFGDKGESDARRTQKNIAAG